MPETLLHRAWRRLPKTVRATAHQAIQATSANLVPVYAAMARRRAAAPAPSVHVAGLLSSTIGLGHGARLFAEALESGGLAPIRHDVGAALQLYPAGESGPAEDRSGGMLISHLNPPELSRWLERTRAAPLRGRRHIGYWAWELTAIPKSWRRAFNYVDEVWCPSTFTADAVRAMAPARIPVRVVPHPIFVIAPAAPDRERFGIAAGECAVLVALDLKSTAARKNPFGALEAYRRAVPQPDGSTRLICKLSGGSQEANLLQAFMAAVAGRPDITVLSETLSSRAMSSLIASADIILSLHRAEGFGLLPAEAMWRGKPVVATGWSGNMDFMDAQSAALVEWTLAPVQDAQKMYRFGLWAEPDVDHAAALLRNLIQDNDARQALGARARAKARAAFDRGPWLAQVEDWLFGEPRGGEAGVQAHHRIMSAAG